MNNDTNSKPENITHSKTFTKMVSFELTESDRIRLNSSIAELVEKSLETKEKLRSISASLRAKITNFEESIKEHVQTMVDGYISKRVQVYERFNWETGKVTLVVCESGKRIEERDMTPEERQKSLLNLLPPKENSDTKEKPADSLTLEEAES